MIRLLTLANGQPAGLPGLGKPDTRKTMQKLFARWVSMVRGGLSLAEIEKALAAESAVGLVSKPIWGESWEAIEDEWEAETLAAMQSTGAKSLADLGFKISFDIDNPFATAYAKEMTARLVTEVGGETKDAIQEIVGRGFVEGHAPRAQAKEIKALIGNTSRDAAAADKRYWKLIADGVSDSRALELTKKYADTLLRRRSENIARTETIEAQNAGLQGAWREADAQGFVADESRRKWIAAHMSDRVCPICRPLHGQYATLGGQFTHPTSGKKYDRPGAHPSCRCTQGLVTPAPGETLPEPVVLEPLPKKKRKT